MSRAYPFFNGKHVVITGAASGIGYALTTALLPVAASMLLVDVKRETLETLRTQSSHVHILQADLSTRAGCEALLEHLRKASRAPDVVFLNAGVALYGRFDAPGWQQIESLLMLNAGGVMYMSGQLLRLFPEVRLCITASSMAFLGIPGYALYAATKAALHRWAQTLWAEGERRLTLVYPIATRTRFFNAAQSPLLFPNQSATQVVKAILRGISRGKRRIFPSRLFYCITIPVFLYEFFMRLYTAYARRLLNQRTLKKQ
ncbi:MAG: short-chain dehydrogenase [Thermonema sp.]|uniref:SDR family NAD(P)-dependent oxidoreductase n=1 Tax=Thermonema sp. TaxID=2231181 RepID=UPI0021DCE805|nr:SDR family NAD(P)-dependent oxidoreductase [Thermonema sp.]GIV40461.1 MAG: short-chain dehydrogenase [Thermonema sp.]